MYSRQVRWVAIPDFRENDTVRILIDWYFRQAHAFISFTYYFIQKPYPVSYFILVTFRAVFSKWVPSTMYVHNLLLSCCQHAYFPIMLRMVIPKGINLSDGTELHRRYHRLVWDCIGVNSCGRLLCNFEPIAWIWCKAHSYVLLSRSFNGKPWGFSFRRLNGGEYIYGC